MVSMPLIGLPGALGQLYIRVRSNRRGEAMYLSDLPKAVQAFLTATEARDAEALYSALASDAVLIVRDDSDNVVAPLAKGSTGAPIFTREGALIGLVAPITGEPLRLGGRLIGQPHAYLAAAAIEKVLSDTNSPAQAAAAMSIGDLLHAKSASVVGVTCAP